MRETTPANATEQFRLCENSMEELNIFSQTEVSSILYQPRRTTRVASAILKMNPTLRYFLSPTLKLASNQLHTSSSNWCQGSHNKLKGTMIRVLVENNFDRDNVCHMAIKGFRSSLTTAMCKCNYNSSRWLKLERFSNFLTKAEYPSFGRHSLNYRWL